MAPLLVFGWGNPSRGDDALGPLFVEHLSLQLGDAGAGRVDVLTDFQLQVEHALDLEGRRQVLFVDASLSCRAPFETTALEPGQGLGVTTHALSPEAVMQVFLQIHGTRPPPCTLLAIRGERFGLGEPPSDHALANLGLAVDWGRRWFESHAGINARSGSTCTN